MTEEQLIIELSDIEKDDKLSVSEKKMYLSIYGAELERQKSDKYISTLKQQIQNLRVKIIDDIINIYSKLDENKREIADSMLYDLGMAASSINTFAIDDVVAEGDIISDTLNGTVPIYVNDEIHKEIEQIMKMENNFHKSIERKYIKLEDKLSDIIEPETFNFVSKEDPSMYKEQREFDEMFVKEKEKIDKLDIGAKEKGMLRNILLDTIKYGKSYGTMYETFDNMSEYVEQKKSEVINGKSI